ncbi:MAG: ECF transporter S component [Eubacteriales bacterium]|nr:ECF transporter S component [Eubacteriales bacterium]
MKQTSDPAVRKLVLGGLLSAAILLLTIVVAIPVPGLAGAYVNLGDTGVYLAAYLLGPYGALAAGIGSMLADILLGSALYAVPTLFIKGLMALLAWLFMKKLKRPLALTFAGLIMPTGYFAFEAMLYGAPTALLGIPANLVQWAVGVLLGLTVITLAARYKEHQ